MNCPRCRGLMLRDESLDLADETGQYRFLAWCCVICGEVLDPLIAEHMKGAPRTDGRLSQAPPQSPLSIRHS